MPELKFITIAIDGGAAAGKSSTSRALSKQFNLMHVDTGSFYRAVTLKLMEAGIKPEAGAELEAGLEKLNLDTAVNGNSASIIIDGWIPDESIRSESVNQNVSLYAAIPAIRKFLLDYQRDQSLVARRKDFDGLVMEGRDIGSVIFPNADLRLFLFADPEKRAARRAAEGIADSIEKRDQMDTSRKTAPLACPEGATFLDTSEIDLDTVVKQVSKMIEKILEE